MGSTQTPGKHPQANWAVFPLQAGSTPYLQHPVKKYQRQKTGATQQLGTKKPTVLEDQISQRQRQHGSAESRKDNGQGNSFERFPPR